MGTMNCLILDGYEQRAGLFFDAVKLSREVEAVMLTKNELVVAVIERVIGLKNENVDNKRIDIVTGKFLTKKKKKEKKRRYDFNNTHPPPQL